MKSQLSEYQLEKVYRRVASDLKSAAWPEIEPGQHERTVTQKVVKPIVESTLDLIGEKRLLLTNDGSRPPKPLFSHGMSFCPDLEIRYLNQRCIAFEVKVLREYDASGSFSKAVGQTLIYQHLGFRYALCLIFDARKRKSSALEGLIDISLTSTSDTSVIFCR